MKMKLSNILVVTLVSLTMLTSCFSDPVVNYAEEPVITRFYLQNKKIEGVSDIVFTIDEANHLIYNADSAAFGMRVDTVFPVISPKFVKIVLDDTISIGYADTIFYDFSKPVKIAVTAGDKAASTAEYTVDVRVHQVDPDTFIWKGVNSQVFSGVSSSEKAFYVNGGLVYLASVGGENHAFVSADGAVWKDNAVEGLDASVVDFKGVVGDTAKLYYVCDNKLYTSADGVNWSAQAAVGSASRALFVMDGVLYGVDYDAKSLVKYADGEWSVVCQLPQPFPVSGAAVCVAPSPSGNNRVFVAGGVDADGTMLSTLWSSDDCVYWSNLNVGEKSFAARTDAALVQYADGLILIGGGDAAGVVAEGKFLFSKDYGLTWSLPEEKMIISSLYQFRYDHSAITTPDGYLFLIGGRTASDNSISDVWQAIRYASIPGFKR